MSVVYHYGEFPPKHLDWARLIPLLGPTAAAIARFDGLLTAIPNANLLLSPLSYREAALSSKIEGTQTTSEEVLSFEALGPKHEQKAEKLADVVEVLNYQRAMMQAQELMGTLPLCLRVIRELHKTLLQGARGAKQRPGEFRQEQNWIGTQGSPLQEAQFVPISIQALPEGLGMMEDFIHKPYQDQLIQLALLHAEFEALHPFKDGNGRIGRMLIPLFLWEKKLIQLPCFYISEYLETKRDEYIYRLRRVSEKGEWTEWCQFFLTATANQAEENTKRAKAILDLYQTSKVKIEESAHSRYNLQALDTLFQAPYFSSAKFISQSGIPAPSARKIISILCEGGIIVQVIPKEGRRGALYSFRELAEIIRW